MFGLTSMWLAMGRNATGRKWAPIVGLCGQPAWAWFAYETKAWGIAALVALYTAVYVRGALVQWRPAK
jgi:hypothetical protein